MRQILTLFYWNKPFGLRKDYVVLLLSFCGGYFCSFSHFSISWMLGAMAVSSMLRLRIPWIPSQLLGANEIQPFWRQLGQLLLSIQIARQIHFSMFRAFQHSWGSILFVLTLSILLSLLSAYVLYTYTSSDLISSLYGTTPGGVSAMPSLASEVGANSVIVTATQVTRNVLVVTIIPFLTSALHGQSSIRMSVYSHRSGLTSLHAAPTSFMLVIWSAVLVLAAYTGFRVWKRFGLPAPALVGGMVGTAFIQAFAHVLSGVQLDPYWPNWINMISQVLIGASIGNRVEPSMFIGTKRILWVSAVCSLIYILLMCACSMAFASWMGIGGTTSILAFAPGGVAEMAITATGVDADAALVVTVQTVRLLIVLLLLPHIFKYINRSSNYEKKL